ncbi:Hypothetical predicted protein [Xyrichtys novacula]|uniref:Uncharacterized protein n=1 Tax=Xyrichtys novacula TaxID=13765 RepID=A0AAV1HTB2_XYRNO|nr:Hypothetical predicted protein [Xyrichtys novacula]
MNGAQVLSSFLLDQLSLEVKKSPSSSGSSPSAEVSTILEATSPPPHLTVEREFVCYPPIVFGIFAVKSQTSPRRRGPFSVRSETRRTLTGPDARSRPFVSAALSKQRQSLPKRSFTAVEVHHLQEKNDSGPSAKPVFLLHLSRFFSPVFDAGPDLGVIPLRPAGVSAHAEAEAPSAAGTPPCASPNQRVVLSLEGTVRGELTYACRNALRKPRRGSPRGSTVTNCGGGGGGGGGSSLADFTLSPRVPPKLAEVLLQSDQSRPFFGSAACESRHPPVPPSMSRVRPLSPALVSDSSADSGELQVLRLKISGGLVKTPPAATSCGRRGESC